MVDLIPKKERKPIFGQVFFLIVSAALFLSVIAAVFILEQANANTALTLSSLKKTLTEDTRPQEERLAQELRDYQQELKALQAALDERRNLLSFFALLEETTHPQLFFGSFEGTLDREILTVSGEASSFFALEQQRLVWNGREEFEEANIRNIELADNGAASFEGEFLVSKEFLEPR